MEQGTGISDGWGCGEGLEKLVIAMLVPLLEDEAERLVVE